MTRFTDKTIPMTCGECQEEIQGIDSMQGHILDVHPGYSAVEAVQYAQLWADDAYEREEAFERDYYADRAMEKSIERLEAKHDAA